MINNNIKVNIFILFLKDNNIYEEYIMEYKAYKRNTLDVMEFLSSTYESMYLSDSFTWVSTRKGFTFWRNIDDEWMLLKDNYIQNRRNELLNKII